MTTHKHTVKVGKTTYTSSTVTDPDPSKAIADAIAAHEKAYHQAPPDPTPPPTPTPPPSTGIPAIPADHELFLRDFSDGQLVEFRKVTYLDSKPLDGMRYATDYTHPIEWPKDGDRTYLRERCIRQPNGRYNGTFLTTGGGMGAPTFSMMRGYVECAFHGWRCGICARPVDRLLAFPNPLSGSIDHTVPVALGGSNAEANLQIAHLICNWRKGAGREVAA